MQFTEEVVASIRPSSKLEIRKQDGYTRLPNAKLAVVHNTPVPDTSGAKPKRQVRSHFTIEVFNCDRTATDYFHCPALDTGTVQPVYCRLLLFARREGIGPFQEIDLAGVFPEAPHEKKCGLRKFRQQHHLPKAG